MFSGDFLRTFAKALAFMLVCGAVGPAFLIIYLAMGDEGPSWMLWNGVAWTAVDVIVAYAYARYSVHATARTAVQRTSAVPGIGRIVGMRETNVEINDRRIVEFTLAVSGPRVTSFTCTVSAGMRAVASAAIAKGVFGVFVSDDGTSADIDWEATALYAGAVPAVFSSTEDGRDYDLTGDAAALVQVVDVLRRHSIPLDSIVDVRSDPAVRDEVMAVVRRHAAAGPVGTPPESSQPRPSRLQPDGRTLTQRLTELDTLFAGGRITREEYDRLRTKALDEY